MLRSGGKDFPGGTVDKGLPVSGGDRGSIPGLGKFHRLRSTQAHVPPPLSAALQQEKSLQREAHTPQRTVAPVRCN